MELTLQAMKKVDASELYRQFMVQQVRPDGRLLLKQRKITVTPGSIGTAHGSAMVKLGGTSVVCGIKGEVAEPLVTAPANGFIVTNIDLSPLCSPRYRPGPPPDKAQVISETLSRLVATSYMVDLSDLCISQGKSVWVLYADIVCLNDDGNLFDAALLSLVAALKNVTLPCVQFSEELGTSIVEGEPLKLTLKSVPVPVTFGVFDGEHVFVDPTAEEEDVMSSSLSIVFNNRGNVVAFLKHGGTALNEEKLQPLFEVAKHKTKEMAQLL